jgi:hypothetical protein
LIFGAASRTATDADPQHRDKGLRHVSLPSLAIASASAAVVVAKMCLESHVTTTCTRWPEAHA